MKKAIILLLILALLCLSNFEYFHDLYSKSHTTKCLTNKPYNPISSSLLYFRDRIENMKKEYETCDNYRCKTSHLNGYTAKGHISNYSKDKLEISDQNMNSVNPEYYHDSETFCKLNPDAYPCPNYWIKNKRITPESQKLDYNPILPVKTYCEEGNQHELALCQINDNQRTMLVSPRREDQGLCGFPKIDPIDKFISH